MSGVSAITARDAGLVACTRCSRVWPMGTGVCGRCGKTLDIGKGGGDGGDDDDDTNGDLT